MSGGEEGLKTIMLTDGETSRYNIGLGGWTVELYGQENKVGSLCGVAEWDKFDEMKKKNPRKYNAWRTAENILESLNNTENKLTNMLSWLLTKKWLGKHECHKMNLLQPIVMVRRLGSNLNTLVKTHRLTRLFNHCFKIIFNKILWQKVHDKMMIVINSMFHYYNNQICIYKTAKKWTSDEIFFEVKNNKLYLTLPLDGLRNRATTWFI